MRGISESEKQILAHWSRWGSDGYPINKYKRGGWSWGPMFGVNGPPCVFRTKREAVASFEAFIDVLIAATGEIAQAAAIRQQAIDQSTPITYAGSAPLEAPFQLTSPLLPTLVMSQGKLF